MKITDVLKKDCIILSLKSKKKEHIIKELTDHLAPNQSDFNKAFAYETIMEREKLCSTALDAGVAIPHGKMSSINNFLAVFGRSIEGVDFESLDGKPTFLFFLLISPDNSSGLHLKLLAKISKIFKIPEFREKVLKAKDVEEIYELIIEEDE